VVSFTPRGKSWVGPKPVLTRWLREKIPSLFLSGLETRSSIPVPREGGQRTEDRGVNDWETNQQKAELTSVHAQYESLPFYKFMDVVHRSLYSA
jgi:hypothetical protein